MFFDNIPRLSLVTAFVQCCKKQTSLKPRSVTPASAKQIPTATPVPQVTADVPPLPLVTPIQEEDTDECRHENIGSYQTLEGPYFTSSYLKKQEGTHYPRDCVLCKKAFASGKGFVDPVNQVKVCTKHVVRCCKNASLKPEHPCVHAYCAFCFTTKVNNSPSKVKNDGNRLPSSRKRTLSKRVLESEFDK